MTMMFQGLCSEISAIRRVVRVGRISELSQGFVEASGLAACSALGDRVQMHTAGGQVYGEIVRIARDSVIILPDSSPEGAVIGDRVELCGRSSIAPDDSWIGRIVDPYGRPLDGRPLFRGLVERELRAPPPPAATRRPLGERLATGMAAFDTLLPLVRGQRLGLFAGSGVGKSSLLARFARGVEADVAVIALVGERGREVREFAERILGPQGMARTVIVTATSDQSPLARRRCAWAAMSVAEYFRDQGKQVLLLVDSITRFAEAHREVAVAAGEDSNLRGFPASTAHMIMSLAERAGPGGPDSGDITAVFSVLVAGSDMDEPIADILRGVLDGHVVLDRKIAERGRYPAIDLLRSVSRSLPGAASADENELIGEARRLLGSYDRAELMIQAGLYASGTDKLLDRAIRLWPGLDAFLSQEEPAGIVASFGRLRQCLSG